MERESMVARDFFGLNSKDCLAVVKEEIEEREFCKFMAKDSNEVQDFKGCSKDSAFTGNSGMQWPFSNKTSAMQQFMSFKSAQEERAKKIYIDQLASSGFQPISTADAFDTNHKSSTVTQKSFSLETRQSSQVGMQAFPVHAHDQAVSAHHSFPVSNHPIRVAMNNPFFKIHGSANASCGNPTPSKPFGGIPVTTQHTVNPVSGSFAGTFAPRNISAIPAKPVSGPAQLTIFYAGAVNVYHDVPLEKAQAIMFLAGNGAAGNTPNPRAPVPMTPKPASDGVHGNQATSPCSGLSSPMSATSHTGAQTAAGSNGSEDLMAVKTVGALAPNNQQEPPKISSVESASALLPRAVPQARKASLARFLEKRKERVSNAAPYITKKSPENSSAGTDGVSLSGTSPGMECALPCSRPDRGEQTWCLGPPKSGAECAK